MAALDQRRFKLTLLTPVHVGSGETLSRGVDILEEQSRDGKTRTFILDVDSLLSRVTPVQADEITRCLASQDKNLLGYLRSLANVQLEQVSLYPPLQRGFPASELRLHIRRGDGNPIIPGSSLKGALRTLILAGMTLDPTGRPNGIGRDGLGAARKKFQDQPKLDPKRAAQPLETLVFRSLANADRPKILAEAHGDLLRCIHTRDIAFCPKDLSISFIRVHSPSRNDPRNFKRFTVAVEALKAKALAETELTIDRQLLQGPWAEKLNFAGRAFTWENLSQWSCIHAERFLTKEKQRAERNGLPGLPEELGKLQSRVQAAQRQGAIALRLGWGIGWEGTTGAIPNLEYRKELLRIFPKMGLPPNAYSENLPFPKSRKLMIGSTNSYTVMGWVLLEPL